MPFPREPPVSIGIKLVHSFSKYRVHTFGSRTYGRTDGQVENIMGPFARQIWRSYKTCWLKEMMQ